MKDAQFTRLAELRKAQGWTLEHVSNLMGVSKATICQYEKGVRAINSKRARQFAEIYGVTTDYILDIDEYSSVFDNVRQLQTDLRERPLLAKLYLLAKDCNEPTLNACIAMLETLRNAQKGIK